MFSWYNCSLNCLKWLHHSNVLVVVVIVVVVVVDVAVIVVVVIVIVTGVVNDEPLTGTRDKQLILLEGIMIIIIIRRIFNNY